MDLVKYSTFPMIISLSGIRGIFLNRRNITIMSMPIESMLLAVNSNFSVFPVYPDDMMGQLFALSVLTVAAAESAIGSAIPVITFRIRRTIAVESINRMKGRAALILILLVRNKKLLVFRFLSHMVEPAFASSDLRTNTKNSSETSAYLKVPITLAEANPTNSELTDKAKPYPLLID
nr:NADH dehydrogenase subunit 4L [Pseudotsuga sinensis var. wilsoniana]